MCSNCQGIKLESSAATKQFVVDCSRRPQNLKFKNLIISRRFLGEDDVEIPKNDKGTCSASKPIVFLFKYAYLWRFRFRRR